MDIKKTITREADGNNQKGDYIGKPKPGDVVALHYNARTMKKNGKKEGRDWISTEHLGPMVNLKCTDVKSTEHKGLYVGLNEVVQTMELGEEATVIIPSAKAFGEEGLSMFYDVSAGYLKSQVGIFGVAMPNNPEAPADHNGRNPLCIAYYPVAPGENIYLELKLIKINEHNRNQKYTCWDCIWSSISQGFGLNSGTY